MTNKERQLTEVVRANTGLLTASCLAGARTSGDRRSRTGRGDRLAGPAPGSHRSTQTMIRPSLSTATLLMRNLHRRHRVASLGDRLRWRPRVAVRRSRESQVGPSAPLGRGPALWLESPARNDELSCLYCSSFFISGAIRQRWRIGGTGRTRRPRGPRMLRSRIYFSVRGANHRLVRNCSRAAAGPFCGALTAIGDFRLESPTEDVLLSYVYCSRFSIGGRIRQRWRTMCPACSTAERARVPRRVRGMDGVADQRGRKVGRRGAPVAFRSVPGARC